jgi:integral membrane protein
MLDTNLGRLRLLAWIEGISFLALIGVGMPLKYLYDMPTPNLIIGMAHGILFIGYCVWVMIVGSEEKWVFKKTFLALFASIVPFGTFVADVRLFKNENRLQ